MIIWYWPRNHGNQHNTVYHSCLINRWGISHCSLLLVNQFPSECCSLYRGQVIHMDVSRLETLLCQQLCEYSMHIKDCILVSCCQPCVEVSGKPLIHVSWRLCLPSSDGYLVEWESWIVMMGYSCSKVRKCWIIPRGNETVNERVPILRV